MVMLGAYEYPWRQKFVIDQTGIGALSNFPLRLISTYIDPVYAQNVRFVRTTPTAKPTVLKHEYVGSVPYGGRWWSEFYVLVPSISGLTAVEDASTIYAYYGASGAPNIEDAEGVWTDATGYVSVWHLDEASGNFEDSTSAGHDSSTETITDRSLRNGPTFDGVDDEVIIADHADWDTGGALTIEALGLKTAGDTDAATYLHHDESAYKYLLYLTSTNNYPTFYTRHAVGGTANAAWASSLNDGAWHYVVGVYDRSLGSSRLKLYADGTQRAASNGYDEDIEAGDEGIKIGMWGAAPHAGFIGEVRISSSARSADWIMATSKNMLGTYVTEYAPEYILHMDALRATTAHKGFARIRTTRAVMIDRALTSGKTLPKQAFRSRMTRRGTRGTDGG